MSYTTARLNKKIDAVEVVERVNGKRVFSNYPVDHTFYIDDPNGKFTSIYGTPVRKVIPQSASEFHKELAILKGKRTWEADINPVFSCLVSNYKDKPAPELQVGLFDIEAGFNEELGYAPIEDPFNPITAITIKLVWLDQLITLAVPPQTVTMEQAKEVASRFENVFMFDNEIDLLNTALDLIDDCDVISGWHSEGFDLPYLVNRIARIMSKDDTRRLCLWGEYPKQKPIEKYGREFISYELIGRTHLDLMDVYRKFTYEERHSYSLDAIADYELGKSKTPYSGSLNKLYNDDFEKFIEYNRQDVILLSELELKLKFIALLNILAHETNTLLTTCMGTVAMVDQAIVNRAHELGYVVPTRERSNPNDSTAEDTGAAGAYVAAPKVGIHEWVGVIDVNGLYPSTIRALNMGIETIIGQLRPTLTDAYISDQFRKSTRMTYASAWQDQFGSKEYQAVMDRRPGVELYIDWEGANKSDIVTAEQCHDLIFSSGKPWMLSGNGTIFTYERNAIIPGLLEDWTKIRKSYQKQYAEATDSEVASHFNRMQHAVKILSNSLYGCLLNTGSRFYDKRIGQSVTLSGRLICRHMNAYVNECVTGNYQLDGEAIIAADTDSSQFSAWSTMKPMIDAGEIEWNKETAVQLYQAIGEKVNDSFAGFMAKAFHCPDQLGKLIRAACESVGYRGLYITKKRYAILNFFKDPKWFDDDHLKLKAMGLDLRRSDTPVVCQEFLTEVLLDLLKGGTEKGLIEKINTFKENSRSHLKRLFTITTTH